MTFELRQRTVADDPAEVEIRAAIAAGRHAHALALLRRAHGAALHRFARRLVDDDAAEDVVQDALLRAYLAMGGVREGSSLRAWLMKIVAHRALDELRRRRRQRRITAPVEPPEVADPRPHPGQLLARRQEARVVTACVDAMPAPLRASVALHFGSELTFAQVGDVLGEQGAASLVRVRRGLARLRGALRRRGLDRAALEG